MLTDTVFEDPRWQDVGLAEIAEVSACATLRYLDIDPDIFEIAVLACDDARIAELNADFRKKNSETNVLSWPAQERSSERDGGQPHPPEVAFEGVPEELGDIAISFDTCQKEAAASGKSLVDHATHLMVHGVLHLLGYDHIRDQDATLMEGLETEILGKMGICDPYMV
nr:rRNA maturation RNase YbeY [uncultured Shimia sp.]